MPPSAGKPSPSASTGQETPSQPATGEGAAPPAAGKAPPTVAQPPAAAAAVDTATTAPSVGMLIGSALVGAIVLGGVLVFLKIRAAGSKKGGLLRSTARTTVKRTHSVVLCGPTGSGKTCLFMRLTGKSATSVKTTLDDGAGTIAATHTSMAANTGVVSADLLVGGVKSPLEIVDYPGHPRLSEGMQDPIEKAACVIFAIDGVRLQDELQTAASMIATLMQSRAFLNAGGPKRLILAVTKRDDVASFTAKAAQKHLEAELTRQLSTRAGAVGAIAREGADNPASLRRADVLTLQDGEKFSFDKMSSVPVEFVECSAAEGGSATSEQVGVTALMQAVARALA